MNAPVRFLGWTCLATVVGCASPRSELGPDSPSPPSVLASAAAPPPLRPPALAPTPAPLVVPAPALVAPLEPAPEHLGSPESSLALRPSWVGWAPMRQPGHYAPSSSEAAALFDAMPSTVTQVGTLDQALVVCRLSTTDITADICSPPDLRVRLHLGRVPEVAESGPNDVPEMHVSRPLVHLSPGQHVSFDLWDRDDFTPDDFLGAAHATFTGRVPFEWHQGEVFAECRAWSRDEVEAELERRLHTFDVLAPRVRARMAQATIAAARFPDWGSRVVGVDSLDSVVEDLAAVVGWDDPRVQRRDATRGVLLAQWASYVHDVIAALEVRLPAFAGPQVLGEGVEVAAVTTGCSAAPRGGPRHPACILQAEVTPAEEWSFYNWGDWLTSSASFSLPRLTLVDEEGRSIPLAVTTVLRASSRPAPRGDVKIPAGERVVLRFGVEPDGDVGPVSVEHAVLVAVGSGAQTEMYRLRDAAPVASAAE